MVARCTRKPPGLHTSPRSEIGIAPALRSRLPARIAGSNPAGGTSQLYRLDMRLAKLALNQACPTARPDMLHCPDSPGIYVTESDVERRVGQGSASPLTLLLLMLCAVRYSYHHSLIYVPQISERSFQ